MHTVTMNMTDQAYSHLMYMIKNIPEIDIIEDEQKESCSDDMKIDVKHCLETLDKIKNGDTKCFSKVNPKELLEELDF
jgi:hypothetical protein